jgi:hypothetical protein
MPPRNDLAKLGTLLLYPFRARDPLTGKWYRARYKAERQEIAARYGEWEIIGPAEIRHPVGEAFSPWR